MHKTEAMCFLNSWNAPRSESRITVGGVSIGVESMMKYLELILNSQWNFKEHFRRLAPRLERTGAAFKRPLPNLGGPNASCWRLYTKAVRSMMALYGAPVWVSVMTEELVRRLDFGRRSWPYG